MKDPNILREKDEFEQYRSWLQPQRVRILMVTDDEGMFNTNTRFGLGHVIEILADQPWWWVRFDVTTTHRGNVPFGLTQNTRDLAAYKGRVASPGKSEIPAKPLTFSFKFSGDPRPELALSNFDVVWLFGIAASAPALAPAEIAAVKAFMDGGGGVLAMGDHSQLGADLCGEIPRVKHMRKWKLGGPAGDPPLPTGASRIDTLRAGATLGVQFEDQSDTEPQPIYPTRYYSTFGYDVFRRRWYPHPVLCGIDGVIDVLPDHMHEGECVVAAALAPADFPGGLEPEVIAMGEVLPHTTDNTTEFPGIGIDVTATARTFGILGAYDGHDPAANVGRIVVDATWHHWVHVNLVGFVNDAPDSAEFAKIKNYYWNVALWLAPRPLQRVMLDKAVYGLPWVQPFDEMRGDRADMYWLGIEAMDAIGRRAGRCAVNEWLKHLFIEFQLPVKSNLPDPPPFEEILQRFAAAILGGMVQQAMVLATDAPRQERSEALIGKALMEGARAGFKHNLKRERERHKAREGLLTQLEQSGNMVTKER